MTEDGPPRGELRPLERLILWLRTAFEVAVFLVALPVVLAIELISGILMVIGVIAMIWHLRANGPRGGDLGAPVRRRMALRIVWAVMWVMDHGPFRDDTRRWLRPGAD